MCYNSKGIKPVIRKKPCTGSWFSDLFIFKQRTDDVSHNWEKMRLLKVSFPPAADDRYIACSSLPVTPTACSDLYCVKVPESDPSYGTRFHPMTLSGHKPSLISL